jgi:hypothetical protein
MITSMGRKITKITVEVPTDVLKRAQKASGEGVTGTVRKALENMARSDAYERLMALRGKVHLTYDIDELREDRD